MTNRAEILESLNWAIGMAQEALMLRESGDDPEDTPEVMKMHRDGMEKAIAVRDALQIEEAHGLETHKMLVLSTAHVSRETRGRLQDGELSLVSYDKDDYGWFIPIIQYAPDSVEDRLDREHWHNHCPDLYAARRLAETNGCTWLMFDRDGDVLEGLLPVHKD